MKNFLKKIALFGIALLIEGLAYCGEEIPKGFSVLGARMHPSAGRPTIHEGCKEALWEKPQEMPDLTPDQKKAGYVVFKKHYMDKIYPYTVPRSYEITKELRCFASPGEYEPMTFAVRTLNKEIKGFHVSVSDLRAKTEELIPSENIEFRATECIPFKDLKRKDICHMKPEILEKAETKDLKAYCSYWYWLTLYVPKGQKAGTYRGTVSLSAQNAPSEKMDILVKVFPVELKNPPTERYMHIGGHEKDLKLRKKYYIDMKEHGMNTVAPCNFSVYPSYRNGIIELNFRRLDEEADLYRKVGFSKPLTIDMRPVQAWLISLEKVINKYKESGKSIPQDIPVKISSFDVSPSGSDFERNEYKKIVNRIIKHAKDRNYPKLYFLPQEESTNKGTRGEQLKIFSKLLKECGATTTSWSNATWSGADDLRDNDANIDIRYYNYVNSKIRERTKKSGDFFGIYNHGDRLMYGFFGRKVKAEGMGQWVYTFGITKNLFDSGKMEYCSRLTYPGLNGPLPSPRWEYIREGIDDAKYIYTLETLIDSQLKSTDPKIRAKAQKAQKDLEDIIKQTPSSTRELNNTTIAWETLDIWRFKIIRMIMELNKNHPSKTNPAKTEKNDVPSDLVIGVYSEEKNCRKEKNHSPIAVSLIIPYTETPPLLDGSLNDAVWQKAVKTRPFVLIHQQAQAKARAVAAANIGNVGEVEAAQKTTARLCYDDENLYMAFKCMESQMDKIVAACNKRDGTVWSDDSIEIFLVPDADMKRYYQMALNSNAVVSDIEWFVKKRKRERGSEWNPGWIVKTKKYSDHWIAEAKIPFAVLGLKKAPAIGGNWKINLAREEQPSGGEYSSWAQLERSFHELHNFGIIFFGKIPIVNIDNLKTGKICYGKNSVILDLQKNINGNLKVKAVLDITQNAKTSSFKRNFEMKNKLEQCEMEYEISGLDDVEITAKIYSEENEMPVSQTVLKSNILPVLNFKCVQKEIYTGAKICRAEAQVNLSPLEMKKMHGTIDLLENGKVLKSGKLENLKAGKSILALNVSNLLPGNFQLAFSLKDKAGKTIAEKKASFRIIENPF